MKPILIDARLTLQNSIVVKDIEVPFLDNPLHFHDAYEIVFIKESEGKRVIGDHVEFFSHNDLIFIGPKLSHAWFNEGYYRDSAHSGSVKARVIYFQPNWLSPSLLESSDFIRYKELLFRMNRGMKILGRTKKNLIRKVNKIKNGGGLRSIVQLLDILETLCSSSEYECLASIGYSDSFKQKDAGKIDKIYQYVMESFDKPIELKQVAAVAHMTPTSFCKYFKMRTQKTFFHFLNEIRISHACKLLYDENLSVSEIYLQCGFNNFSNFNRTFRKFKKMSPTTFRANLNA
jgi:AraC-like DNA-binding protein